LTATLTANARAQGGLSIEIHFPLIPVRNATVAGIRDARTAGIRPANAPIRMAEAMPPDHASAGITTAQLFELAYRAVAAAPASTPTTPPMTASRIDSTRKLRRNLALRRYKGATEADLRAAFQNRDVQPSSMTSGRSSWCQGSLP
jgi:hypothetical protein